MVDNIRNGEYLRVLSWDLKVFTEINKYIFTVVRSQGIKHAKLEPSPPPPPFLFAFFSGKK